ncbi:MAG: hypothetical protein Q7R30_24335 [Acidobacteriota bacterium]|nr:hypothetical protein [Acidobacteriota bacterium]
MTPGAFTFKLTVPRDPALADVVSDLVQHAVGYAGMTEEGGAGFVKKVKVATAAELAPGATPHCLVVIAATGGELRVTIGSQTVSQPIAA